MDKISTEKSIDGSISSTTTPTEKRSLSDVVHNTKRSGGSYGSLAKSQLQPTFYIYHKVESNDTIQRLALKYSINVGCFFFLQYIINKTTKLF
jgi:LysM repeat protein